MITAFQVDDHPVRLPALADLINAECGFSDCGAAGTVEQAQFPVESAHPDLVTTDIKLSGRNGLELIRDLGAFHPEILSA